MLWHLRLAGLFFCLMASLPSGLLTGRAPHWRQVLHWRSQQRKVAVQHASAARAVQ